MCDNCTVGLIKGLHQRNDGLSEHISPFALRSLFKFRVRLQVPDLLVFGSMGRSGWISIVHVSKAVQVQTPTAKRPPVSYTHKPPARLWVA
jgi:hypothetical protein